MRTAARFSLLVLIVTIVCLLGVAVFQIDPILPFSAKYRYESMEVDRPFYANRTGKHCYENYEKKYDWGEMCPKLYTELGGKCDMIDGQLQCPDIRNYSKVLYRQGQLVLTRMMRIFDLLAQKYDIFYWITRGTLLGAARHQGFIPWDVDSDIEMPLDDYVKFFQVAAKDLPPDIFFQNSLTDPAFPNNSRGFHKHELVGLYEATWNPRLRDRNSCYKYCIAHGCNWHDGLMIDIFVHPHVSRYVYPLKRLPFEGFTLSVQNNWKDELVSQFGKNWFEFPRDGTPVEHPDVFNGCEKLKN